MKNKIIFYSFYFIFSNSTICFSQGTTFFTGGNICETDPWQLVFHDEFNGNSIDLDKWTTWLPYGSTGDDQCAYCRLTDKNSQQVYLDKNIVLSNGILKITTKHEKATWYGETREYTSGIIYSRGINKFMYGKFEIRCKIPSGHGFWPAFWLFGGSGPTEIDCFEFGGETPTKDKMNLHYDDDHESSFPNHFGLNYDNGTDYSLAFHVFSVEWDPFFITYRIDFNNQVWR